jgi:hypothetical protein
MRLAKVGGMSVRCFVVTALLCAAVGVRGQDSPLQKAVSFSAPPHRAEKLFEELSERVGVRLATAPQTAGEVLLIHVRDVPLHELMAQIALSASAEWREEEGLYRLVRPAALARREAQEEARRQGEWIREVTLRAVSQFREKPMTLERAREVVAAASDSTSPMVQRLNVASDTPAARALVALVHALDPVQLAQMGRHERVVYSTSPTRMQLPFPQQAQPVLQQFLRDQAIYNQVEPVEGRVAGSFSVHQSGNGFSLSSGDKDRGPGRTDSGIGLALLTIRRINQQYMIGFIALDGKGLPIAAHESSLMVHGPPEKVEVQDPRADRVEFTPEALAYFQLIDHRLSGPRGSMSTRFAMGPFQGVNFELGWRQAFDPRHLTAELRQKLLDPVTFEPLSLGFGEPLIAVADSEKRNLVACLPDIFMIRGAYRFKRGIRIDEVIPFSSTFGLQLRRSEGWLTFLPNNPASARAARVNRESLRTLIRAATTARVVSLDAFADYASNIGESAGQSIDVPLLRVFNPSAATTLERLRFDNYRALRFYAGLGPSHRQVVRTGGSITVANLPPASRQALQELIFFDLQAFHVTASGSSLHNQELLPFFGMLPQFERTVVMPNGLPGNIEIRYQPSVEAIAYAYDPKLEVGEVLKAETLASDMFISTDGELTADFGTPPTYSLYAPARRYTYTIQIMIDEKRPATIRLTDDLIDPSARLQGFDTLPAEFRSRVLAAVEYLRQRHAESSFTDRSRPTTGPPPPLP